MRLFVNYAVFSTTKLIYQRRQTQQRPAHASHRSVLTATKTQQHTSTCWRTFAKHQNRAVEERSHYPPQWPSSLCSISVIHPSSGFSLLQHADSLSHTLTFILFFLNKFNLLQPSSFLFWLHILYANNVLTLTDIPRFLSVSPHLLGPPLGPALSVATFVTPAIL